jgi:hypothetical protein
LYYTRATNPAVIETDPVDRLDWCADPAGVVVVVRGRALS